MFSLTKIHELGLQNWIITLFLDIAEFRAVLYILPWLKTEIPILDVYGKSGEVSEEYDIRWRAERLKNHETDFVSFCLHFVQEDQP